MPGDPGYIDGGFEGVRDFARRDIEALLTGGISQMIVENFGSAPFRKGTVDDPVEPHVHAFMARIVADAMGEGAVVGVNCLRNDGVGALGVAAATGAHFIRVNVLSGAYVTDQGLIEGEAARLLRYRRALGVDNVAIIADVLVKQASPLAPLRIEDAVKDTVHRGGASAIVVSGSGTGAATDLGELERASSVATVPVLVGSGATLQSVRGLRSFADGLIVGTALKRDGNVRSPVDPDRVRAFVETWSST